MSLSYFNLYQMDIIAENRLSCCVVEDFELD